MASPHDVIDLGKPIALSEDNYNIFCFALKQGHKFRLRAQDPRRRDVTKGKVYEADLHSEKAAHLGIIDDKDEHSCIQRNHLQDEDWDIIVGSDFPALMDLDRQFHQYNVKRIESAFLVYDKEHVFTRGDKVVQKKNFEFFDVDRINPVMVFVEYLEKKDWVNSIIPPGDRHSGMVHDCRIIVQTSDESVCAALVLACSKTLEPYIEE